MPEVIRLEYRNVTMRFAQMAGHLTAVQGVSIAVRDGEVVSLIGPSGCGKIGRASCRERVLYTV